MLAGDDILSQSAHQTGDALAAQVDRAIELMRQDRSSGEYPERALAAALVGIFGKGSQDGDAQNWRFPRIGLSSQLAANDRDKRSACQISKRRYRFTRPPISSRCAEISRMIEGSPGAPLRACSAKAINCVA